MTDPNHIEVLQGFAITYDAQSTIGQAFRAAIAALSARASAGEGGEYVLVPRRLTAENGAKGLLSGEFAESVMIDCPECESGTIEGAEHCEVCGGEGQYRQQVPVEWTTIKEIHRMVVEHLATAAPQPAQAAASGGMTFAFMAEVCDAAVQAMQANGLIKRTIRLQEVRDQLRQIAAAPQPQEAPAQATDFARGLAEHDAKLYGTGFLVDGVRVAPDRIEIIAAAPQPQTPCSDYPNCPNLACPPGCAKPSTPPAHGDGEGDSRAEFERWVAKRWGYSTERWADSGEYRYQNTRDWWQCWQAALTTRPTPEAQGARDAVETKAQALYNASIGDSHNLHCLHWLELTQYQRIEWRKKAALALPAQGEGNNG